MQLFFSQEEVGQTIWHETRNNGRWKAGNFLDWCIENCSSSRVYIYSIYMGVSLNGDIPQTPPNDHFSRQTPWLLVKPTSLGNLHIIDSFPKKMGTSSSIPSLDHPLWRIIPVSRLISIVFVKSPQDRVVPGSPSKWPWPWLMNGSLLNTYKSWDDPPSTI